MGAELPPALGAPGLCGSGPGPSWGLLDTAHQGASAPQANLSWQSLSPLRTLGCAAEQPSTTLPAPGRGSPQRRQGGWGRIFEVCLGQVYMQALDGQDIVILEILSLEPEN